MPGNTGLRQRPAWWRIGFICPVVILWMIHLYLHEEYEGFLTTYGYCALSLPGYTEAFRAMRFIFPAAVSIVLANLLLFASDPKPCRSFVVLSFLLVLLTMGIRIMANVSDMRFWYLISAHLQQLLRGEEWLLLTVSYVLIRKKYYQGPPRGW